jgi:hypothetical protein
MDYFSRLFGCCIANRRNEEIDFPTKLGKNDIIMTEDESMSIQIVKKAKEMNFLI